MRNSQIGTFINFPSGVLGAVVLTLIVLGPVRPCGAAEAQPDSLPACPVEDYFTDWFTRVTQTQAEQPHWVTPLVTVTPRLEEEYRYDQMWQARSSGQTLTSYGGGKGLEVIPTEQTEIILGVPAWQSRNKPSGTDGWGDESFLLKYRILAANEQNGNYILSAFLGLTLPTGSDHNTVGHTVFTPTIAFGKGWGDFDFQSTVAVSVPDHDPDRFSTPLMANTALQYRLFRFFWPEVEFNYTYWPNGSTTGHNQLYVTPGLVVGRIPIWQRLGLTVGFGYQIAVTDQPVYHNNAVLSVRAPF